jgi:hypothetical protein
MSRTIFLQKINLGIKEFDAAIESVEKLRKVRPDKFVSTNTHLLMTNMELLAYRIHISQTYYKLSTNCKRAFMDQKPQAFLANTVSVLGSNPGSPSRT